MMNNFGRGNWFLMFGLFVVGMAVLAGAVTWVGSDVIYYVNEDTSYYHNLSANITGFDSDITFEIAGGLSKVNWTNASGSFLVDKSVVSSWISVVDSVTGNLIINATYDNQTGFFIVPIKALNATGDDTITDFEFIVNATNDAPEFTNIADNYSFSVGGQTNFTFIATDEEDHFPLIFDVVFNSTCVHGDGTGRNSDENCSLGDFGLTVTNSSDETALISFTPTSADIGTYWANVSVMDAAVDYDCPHDWCDVGYNQSNQTYSQMVKFTVFPSLDVDVSNCSGATLMEDVEFNCTIIITTPGETDDLTLTSDASFREGVTSDFYNESWFVLDDYSPTAVNFNHNVSISVVPTKSDVGNLTINFTVNDGLVFTYEQILIYVNFTESNVSLDSIGDMTLYENGSFDVIATDEDLFVLYDSIKDEDLTFASNTSWVIYVGKSTNDGTNYSTATFDVDWDEALLSGVDNYSIMINVTDDVGNTDNQTFVIEILDENAPEWNASLSDPVYLSLTEDDSFSYNVSMNVSDEDGDAIIFYYDNVSEEFCSLDSTNFNSSSGIISFTPEDCDVGEHNVTIIAGDGNLNSTARQFIFTVDNLADPSEINDLYLSSGGGKISEGESRSVVAGVADVITLKIDDDDFLIPSGQRAAFYDESLTVVVTTMNSSDVVVANFFDPVFAAVGSVGERMIYSDSFTPLISRVDNYTIFINITDTFGGSINRTFGLNVTGSSNLPNLTTIENQSITIYDTLNFTANASDDEDDNAGINLSYAIYNLSVGSPNLTIDNETGVVGFDMDSNSSYAGAWRYNVTVNDSTDVQPDWQVVYVYVYGNATLASPSVGTTFSLNESVAGVLNFSVNHSVQDNLTYEFWIDSISCAYQNSSNCNYENLSLRETVNSFGDGTSNNWSFLSDYTDETYGNLKNLTVSVYPNTTNLNSTQRDAVATNFSFKLNVSHTNAPVAVLSNIPNPYPDGYFGSTPISISLSSYFSDEDYSDSYYLQNVTFNVSTGAADTIIRAESNVVSSRLPWNGVVDDWSLQLYGEEEGSENVTIFANDSFGEVSNGPFTVNFVDPADIVVRVPATSRGSRTKLKHFSLKLIVPQDIIISELGFIDIPFAVQNNGQVDLRGISLNSFVRFNNAFSDDVKISLGDNYIEELKIGQSENFTMRITANTQREGRYKATILANVTSPKFSDYGDFFIEIRKANESEAEQILIFTEKFIVDNAECLELTELMKLAEEAFLLGEYSNSLRLAREVTDACEDAIEANEQIRYGIDGFVEENFYYISFATLVIFFVGFVFYIYKRVRFNKSGMDEYV